MGVAFLLGVSTCCFHPMNMSLGTPPLEPDQEGGSPRDFPHLEYGAVGIAGPKDEDQMSVAFSSRLACFGVFDGHGGKQASQYAAEVVHHRVIREAAGDDAGGTLADTPRRGEPHHESLSGGAAAAARGDGAVSEEALTRAFEGVNEDLWRQSGHLAGTTAVCLYVAQPDATGVVDVTCSWVGDSEAMAVVQQPVVSSLGKISPTALNSLPPSGLSGFAPPPSDPTDGSTTSVSSGISVSSVSSAASDASAGDTQRSSQSRASISMLKRLAYSMLHRSDRSSGYTSPSDKNAHWITTDTGKSFAVTSDGGGVICF